MIESVARRRRRGLMTRVAVIAGMLGGTLLLVRGPSPASPLSGRGHHTHVPSREAVEQGYEITDLSARTLGHVLTGLAGTAFLIVGIVFFLVWLFGRWDMQRYQDLTAEQVAPVTPPGPHILVHPEEELRAVQSRERHLLESYAWIDPQHTRAHIPIERAMKLVVGQSLDAAP